MAKQKKNNDRKGDLAVKDRAKNEIKKPRKFKVVLINDDFTPMEFVCELLVYVFRKSAAEATRLMLTIHESGKGIAGVYTKEIAEAKAVQAQQFARAEGHPLMATIEAE
jgi:ATP-dependent Clp protease adaptor protein ClpS